MSADILERWLAAVVATPGMTALRNPAAARAVLLDDALRAVDLVAAADGPVVVLVYRLECGAQPGGGGQQ